MTDAYIPVWEDLPRRVGRGGRREPVWPEVLNPLRERPHKWARVRGPVTSSSATSTASNLRNGTLKGVDPAEFEFAARTVDGEGFVYARYVGYRTTP